MSVDTKVQLKLTALIFFFKFAKKEYFPSKAEKSHFLMRPSSSLTLLNFSARGPTDTTVFECLFSF